MRRWWMIGWIVLAGTGLAMAAEPAAEVTGIRVAAPAKDPELGGFGWEEGVTIHMQITVQEGTIVELDRDACKVASMKDDKGTDLLGQAKPRSFGEAGFGMMANYAKDRKACAVEIRGRAAPARGATSISLQGEAVVSIGSQTKDAIADNVALKVGTKFTLGDIPFEITKTGKPDWGDGMAITVRTDRSLAALEEINFIGADGKKLEVKEGSKMSMNNGMLKTVDQEYVFTTLPATVKITAKVWSDLKTVKVPIDVKVGLGL